MENGFCWLLLFVLSLYRCFFQNEVHRLRAFVFSLYMLLIHLILFLYALKESLNLCQIHKKQIVFWI